MAKFNLLIKFSLVGSQPVALQLGSIKGIPDLNFVEVDSKLIFPRFPAAEGISEAVCFDLFLRID